jgi:hypothetical protein
MQDVHEKMHSVFWKVNMNTKRSDLVKNTRVWWTPLCPQLAVALAALSPNNPTGNLPLVVIS